MNVFVGVKLLTATGSKRRLANGLTRGSAGRDAPSGWPTDFLPLSDAVLVPSAASLAGDFRGEEAPAVIEMHVCRRLNRGRVRKDMTTLANNISKQQHKKQINQMGITPGLRNGRLAPYTLGEALGFMLITTRGGTRYWWVSGPNKTGGWIVRALKLC